MNTDQVVEKILAEAKSEADKISQQADKELAKIKVGADEKLKAFKAETDKLAEVVAADKKQRMMAAARMEAGKLELQTKHDAIDEVFANAFKKLKDMDGKSYLELMAKLMSKAVETGDEQVILAQGENKITVDFIKEVNRSLGNGYKGNLTLSNEKCKGQAGFVLKRADITTNVTLDVLLGQAKSDIEIEIANELFAN